MQAKLRTTPRLGAGLRLEAWLGEGLGLVVGLVTLGAGDSKSITDHQLLYETNAGKATDDSAVRGGTMFRGVVRGGARDGVRG